MNIAMNHQKNTEENLNLKDLRITEIEIFKAEIPLIKPITISLGTYSCSENLFVKIHTNYGEYGLGEACPDPFILGSTLDTDFEIAQIYARFLIGKNPIYIESLIISLSKIVVNQTSILNAFDNALYDLKGKLLEIPVYQLLGGSKRNLHTDMTIPIHETLEETKVEAQKFRDKGFTSIKLKVGREGYQDVPYINMVREIIGDNAELKIDTNQGWSYTQALKILRKTKDSDLLYSEQPLPAWDYRNHKKLRLNAPVPICADESLFSPIQAFQILSDEIADYLNIKLGKSGGICNAIKIDEIAKVAGAQCMIGCFSETKVGLTAAAHFAMAHPNILFIDLDSALILEEIPVINGIKYNLNNDGEIITPKLKGMGVDLEQDYLKTLPNLVID